MRKVLPPLVICSSTMVAKFLALPSPLVQHVLVMPEEAYLPPPKPQQSAIAALRAAAAKSNGPASGAQVLMLISMSE